MVIREEYYGLRHINTKYPQDKYFVNINKVYDSDKYLFPNLKNLKRCIDKENSHKAKTDVSIFVRKASSWKKYSGSIAGVLPNVQFGLFEKFNNNWCPAILGGVPELDSSYFDNLSDAESELEFLFGLDKIYKANSAKAIFYREVSPWETV